MKLDGMEPEETTPSDATTPRGQAEEVLRGQLAQPAGPLSHVEALALIHELQVHQVELQLQNEELVRTRQEAEALRDRYADLYDFAPVGYFTLDAGGVIQEANLTGSLLLSLDRQSLIGARFAAFLHPDGLPLFTAFCDRVQSSGVTETCDLPLSGAPGHRAWYAQLRGRAEPSRDPAGARIRLAVSDVTARRQAEKSLRENDRRHAFLLALGDRLREPADAREIMAEASEMLGRHLDAGRVSFWEVDPAGEHATVSSGWTDGSLPDAAGWYRLDDFGIGDLYRQGLVRRTEDVTAEFGKAEAAAHHALRIRASVGIPLCHNGRLAAVLAVYSARPRSWTDAEVELVREAGDRVWTAVERARAEEALRERERILEGIFRAAPVGIGMASHRTITMANDQLCRMTGYSRDELIGRDARLLYTTDEAYAHVGCEKYSQIAESGTGAVETQWRTKDGPVLEILLSSSPVDLSRPHENVIFIALDITKLRESERALEVYMDDLRQSNEELQQFAYVASHDLQEPLRSIVSFSQLLDRRYRGKLDADADDYINFIVEGGNRMQMLIQDLLQLSRIETTAHPPVPVDTRVVVADVLRTMEPGVRETGGIVTVCDLPVVMADAAQLAQVFMNLVGNALKYRRDGVPPAVRISAERAGAFWRFAVADNGIGIEAGYFERIFVIFQRLHTREEYEGTGIGLAVVRKIVERHGGTVHVESTPGEGSTFFFTLPAA